MTSQEDTKMDMAQISVTSRIPDFWSDQPRVWFIQLEAILNPQKLSDEVKYNVVISKLGKEAISQVVDILANPPETSKYVTIKKKLLEIYEESESKKIQKLIGEMDLGERKPSQLLRYMKELARDKVTDNTLKVMWQNHLPKSIRAVLAVMDEKDLNQLATIADKIQETTSPEEIAEIRSPTPSQGNELTTILAEIKKINIRIDQLERKNFARSRSGSRGRNQNPVTRRMDSRSRDRRQRNSNSVCHPHLRFGADARYCRQPCSWADQQRSQQPAAAEARMVPSGN